MIKYHSDTLESDLIKVIPNYNELSASLLALLRKVFDIDQKHIILDLGTGSGRLISTCLTAGIVAKYIGIDCDIDMLDVAKTRAKAHLETTFLNGDILRKELWDSLPYNQKFSAVLSGFTFHHFTRSEKHEIYSHIYQSIKVGGCYVNQDLFCASTDALSTQILNEELMFMKKNNVSLEWIKHYQQHRLLNDIATELDILETVGFLHVDCHYKYLQSAIIIAYK